MASFSIIIPLYNKEQTIEQTIQSVLMQKMEDMEILVIDDGSTDNSASLVKQISDGRIRLISVPNGGPSSARNHGIREAKNDWLLFLDADDLLLPEALCRFEEVINQFPGYAFYTGAYLVDGVEKKRYSRHREIRNIYKSFLVDWFMPLAGTFICKRELAVGNSYDKDLWILEDAEFIFRILRNRKSFYFPIPVVNRQCAFLEASLAKRPIEMDFRGNLVFQGKSFWEKAALYHLYRGAMATYPQQAADRYPNMKRYHCFRYVLAAVTYYRGLRNLLHK